MQEKLRAEKQEKKSDEELKRNYIFYPTVEIHLDAWDVLFSYSLVWSSVHIFN